MNLKTIDGYKTYGVMVLVILFSMTAYFKGDINYVEVISIAAPMAGLSTVRHAISKATERSD